MEWGMERASSLQNQQIRQTLPPAPPFLSVHNGRLFKGFDGRLVTRDKPHVHHKEGEERDGKRRRKDKGREGQQQVANGPCGLLEGKDARSHQQRRADRVREWWMREQ